MTQLVDRRNSHGSSLYKASDLYSESFHGFSSAANDYVGLGRALSLMASSAVKTSNSSLSSGV